MCAIKYFLLSCLIYMGAMSHVGVCCARYLQAVSIDVYFSPHGGAQEAILKSFEEAQKEIRVMAYSFTAQPIAKGLVEAHKRGVDVVVIFDKSQSVQKKKGGSVAQSLACAGIAVYIDRAHAIAHNKVIIIDGYRVITGSYNFSNAAEKRNAENTIIIYNQEIAEEYLQNFIQHLDHAVIFSSLDCIP